jgi:hypothetical protein
MRLLIAAARLAYLTVSQACAAPRRQAIFGRRWWAFEGHCALVALWLDVLAGGGHGIRAHQIEQPHHEVAKLPESLWEGWWMDRLTGRQCR